MTRPNHRARVSVPRAPRTVWLSAHIFTRTYAPELLDDVLLDVLVPILDHPEVKSRTVRAFFIRHGEYGPHLRLRIKTPGSAAPHLRARIETEVAARLAPAQRGLPTHALPDTASRGAEPSLVFLPYLPEEVRYGGAGGLAAAEAFFHSSAKTSAALIAAIRADRLDRAGVGLAVMVAHLHGLARGEPQAATLARAYADSFGQAWVERWYGQAVAEEKVARPVRERREAIATQLRGLRRAAREGLLPAPIRAYVSAAARYRKRLTTLIAGRKFFDAEGRPFVTVQEGLTYVAPSLMHMTTNRLGIDNLLECCLTEGLAYAHR